MILVETYTIFPDQMLTLPEGAEFLDAFYNEYNRLQVVTKIDYSKPMVDYSFVLQRHDKDLSSHWKEIKYFYPKAEGLYVRRVQDKYVTNLINEAVSDCVQDLLYHNRHEDDTLVEGDIEEAIHDGLVSIDDLVEMFRSYLKEELTVHEDILN